MNINNSIADLQRQLDELAQIATKSQMWETEDQLNRLNREQYILDNTAEWLNIGQKYKQWREDRFLSKSEVARSIGVAPSTLTKFEEGQPTRLAANIQAGYDMVIELDKLKRKYGRYGGNIANVEQYIHSVANDILTLTEEECHEIRTAIKIKGFLELKAAVTAALGILENIGGSSNTNARLN